MTDAPSPTATMLAIGDELLSGRTKDLNVGHLADAMSGAGIDLIEVRFVRDDEDVIVEALNALRERGTYCFTSGGIGPTHDDITADAVSKAFGVPCEHDADAMALLRDHYTARGYEFTEGRQRMARMPRGARHIENRVSVAPGFNIGNVYVMAGVPPVFQAMLDAVIPTLEGGAKVDSRSVSVPRSLGEGDIAAPLAEIDRAHSAVVIGSYPRFQDGGYAVEIVLRSRDGDALQAAHDAVTAMVAALDGRVPATG